MMQNQRSENMNREIGRVFLGTGGTDPGISCFNVDDGTVNRVMQSPMGHSVYAIDIHNDSEEISFGTKGGYLYQLPDSADQEGQLAATKIIQGAGVLSVCALDSMRVATSDAAGRCFIWDRRNTQRPHRLATGDDIICALFKSAENHLAGVSRSGKLVLWDIACGQVVNIIPTPCAARFSALIKPIWWPVANGWCWPGQDGMLVIYHPDIHQVDAIKAHKDDFYGIGICRDHVYTIGKDDGILKIWESGNSDPVESYSVPVGAATTTSWPNMHTWKILLGLTNGSFQIYDYSTGRLDFSRNLPVRDCRTCTDLDVSQYYAFQQRRIKQDVTHICRQIQRAISSQSYDVLSDLYQQLDSYGFKHIYWAMKLKEAQITDQVVMKLECYLELEKLSGGRIAFTHHKEYIDVLCQYGFVDKAISVIQGLDDSCEYALKMECIRNLSSIQKEEDYIWADRLNSSYLHQIADMLQCPITGRILLERLKPCRIRKQITSSEFLDIFDSFQHIQHFLPATKTLERISWFSELKPFVTKAIIFKDQGSRFSNIEICLGLCPGVGETLFEVAILLNAGEYHGAVPITQHNQQINDVFEYVSSLSELTTQIRNTLFQIIGALRLLYTIAKASKKELGVLCYE